MSAILQHDLYDPNRITRRIGYLAMWTTVLWPVALLTCYIVWQAGAMLAAIAAIPTALLFRDLRQRAQAKGHHPAWCWFALLGIVGLVVVFALPDYSQAHPARGFAVTPTGHDPMDVP